MTTLTLYHSFASPNARRVRIFLAEKGVDTTMVAVDLGSGEQHGDAYRAINPRQVVPTLVTSDGAAIGEVPAIWRFIEESYPAMPLLGTTALEKARIVMWERRMELEGFAAVTEGIRNQSPGLKHRAIAGPHAYPQIPELVERGRRRVADFFNDLEARLGEADFVAGDSYSAADITAMVTVDFADRALRMSVPTANAATRARYEVVALRPCAAA